MLALIIAAGFMTAAPERPSDSARVKELQKERIAALRETADVSMKLAQSARVELSEALEDRINLLKAEVDAAENGADRIALYKKAIDSLKEYEAMAKTRFEAGRGTQVAMLRVKARRIEVEIALERLK